MSARFREERLAVLQRRELRGAPWSRAYAEVVDGWLRELLADERDVALVAVGGYGRAELCPGSDIDVLLVHRGRRDIAALAEHVWYPLWDSGVKVGHGVRTVKEAIALASTDLEVATSLLTARPVAGDAGLAAELAERALVQWRRRATRWLDALGRSVADRHGRAGEVAFLVEPDLKEGRGGLRDVHALRWAEAADRILLPGDDERLQAAYDTLLEVRVELQRRTGKPADLLLLQEQDAVAAALDDRDADILMARVAAAARTIAWTSDEAWWRVASSLRGPSGRVAGRDREVDHGIVLRDGVVELAPGSHPSIDAAVVLRAAAAAAEAGTRLGRATLDRLAADAVVPPDQWPAEARQALIALLGAGRPAIAVLEALDQKGLLVRLVPEWANVRSRPQRNAYHRFTVDRHLCETAAEAAALTSTVSRPDLLLVAAWLHDIGKGIAGDHTAAGEAIVERIGGRLGFGPADVATLVALVRHHLLLADTATRRDLDDPATLASVAAAVGDLERLALLHALTEADSLATGPSAWGPWKAGLVGDLVRRVRKTLAGERIEPEPEPLTAAQQALVARARAARAPAIEVAGAALTVAAPDRPGLFSRVAGTLTLHGLDVLSARAWSAESDVAVEIFEVASAFGEPPDWSAVEADLGRVLAGRLSVEARIAERARTYATRIRPLAAVPARTHVAVDNDASATATVVEVRAPDRLGTLYRVTRALAELDLDIRHAKVATLGHEVVDAFYVVDATGAKVTDADHAREIERAVLVELGRV